MLVSPKNAKEQLTVKFRPNGIRVECWSEFCFNVKYTFLWNIWRTIFSLFFCYLILQIGQFDPQFFVEPIFSQLFVQLFRLQLNVVHLEVAYLDFRLRLSAETFGRRFRRIVDFDFEVKFQEVRAHIVGAYFRSAFCFRQVDQFAVQVWIKILRTDLVVKFFWNEYILWEKGKTLISTRF